MNVTNMVTLQGTARNPELKRGNKSRISRGAMENTKEKRQQEDNNDNYEQCHPR